MSSMAASTAFDREALRRGIEQRDPKALAALYDENADLRMVDRQAQPSHPKELHGRKAIGELLDDVYGRDMSHTLEQCVVEGDHLAFMESCRYPDGVRVLASSVADLRDGRIVDQTMIQAWDE